MKRALLCVAILAAGCAGDGYRTEPLPVEPERGGVIEAVRVVPIGARGGSIAGTVVGGSVGAAAGSTVGSGRGSQAASVAGAVAGTIAGNVLAGSVSAREGVEITVRLDSGRQLLVVQAADENFKPGDRVRVLSEGRALRVTR